MFWQLAVAFAAAIAASFMPGLSAYWGWVLVISVVVAFVIEVVGIVPQQCVWRLERQGGQSRTIGQSYVR